MKLAHYLINEVIQTDNEKSVNILVIENQNFFTEVLTDLSNQVCSVKGKFVLSKDNTPIEISKNLELITQFIPFELNKRTLVNKLLKKADIIAQNEDFILRTKELYSYLNRYIQLLVDDIDHDIDFLYEYEISCILKAIDFKFKENYVSISEKIIDYMLLIREFENDKCFILVNIRNYIEDNVIDDFYKTILYNFLNIHKITT